MLRVFEGKVLRTLRAKPNRSSSHRTVPGSFHRKKPITSNAAGR
ncbi:MAG: hypothetical protein WAW96_14155 [Alphaproteobacteria bacterium]